MNNTSKRPRLGYRVEVTASMSGHVSVLTYRYANEGTPGWFLNKQDALRDASNRMNRLAYELLRKADELTRDERGS